jgi:hypothetical protein
MKTLNALNIAAVFAAAIVTLAGCKTSLTGPEELSAEDEMYLIKNARQILLDSKKIKLNSKEKYILRTTQPKLRCYYEKNKCGKASIIWDVSGERRVIAIAEGELATTKRKWKVMTFKKPAEIYVTPDAAKRLSPEAKKRLNIKEVN